tara:strand:- start:35 stop:1474 length:1440 start_codon:yes stop_codon:yes gene_type:complete
MKSFYQSTLVLFIFTTLIACSVNPVSGDKDFVLFSEEREIELGRIYNAQVRQEEKVYVDTELSKYVQALGDKLAGISHRSNLVYRFIVLDSPDVNAFALPGGYIFIYRGLMSYLSSEEELAAVLGHELGHVTARHSVRLASRAQVLDILSYAVGSRVGSTAGNVANLASGAFLAGYGRDMELQADSLGAEYMAQLGYSTKGMIKTISVLKEQELYSKEVAKRRGSVSQTYHGVFSSHPSNDNRLQEIVRAVEVKSSRKVNSHFNLYLNKIDGMVYGDSESDGIRRRNSFYHADLDIHLTSPKDWEIINTPSTLIFGAPKGEATMSLEVIDLNRKESPKEYLNRLSQGDLFQERAINLGGFEGHTGLLIQDSKTHRIAVVFKDKQIFRFFGSDFNLSKDMQKYDDYFMDIINSFRGLKEKEKKLTKPLRIKVYKVKPEDSYASLAKISPIPFDPEKKLRLLNGDYPNRKITVGRVIKLVE